MAAENGMEPSFADVVAGPTESSMLAIKSFHSSNPEDPLTGQKDACNEKLGKIGFQGQQRAFTGSSEGHVAETFTHLT